MVSMAGEYGILEEQNSADMQTVIQHLTQLRKVIIICLITAAVGVIAIYSCLLEPVMTKLTSHLVSLEVPIIYTSVTAAFTTELQVALIGGLIIAFPVNAVIIWLYIAPAFYKNEKKHILIYVVISILLFCVGIFFCYKYFYPFVLNFFLNTTSIDMTAMLTIDSYIKFMCKIIFPFGLLCEMPIVIVFLTRHKIVSVQKLGKWRKYIILLCVIVGAILTPPDVVSQLCVAIPMYVLYESGILISRILDGVNRRRIQDNI